MMMMMREEELRNGKHESIECFFFVATVFVSRAVFIFGLFIFPYFWFIFLFRKANNGHQGWIFKYVICFRFFHTESEWNKQWQGTLSLSPVVGAIEIEFLQRWENIII